MTLVKTVKNPIFLEEPKNFDEWCKTHLHHFYNRKLPDDFEQKCRESKKLLLKIFGSAYKKYHVCIDKKDLNILYLNNADQIIRILSRNIFNSLDVPKEKLTKTHLEYGSHKNIKTTKYLSTYLAKTTGGTRYEVYVTDIGKLLKEQENDSVQSGKYSIHILFGPHSYLQIGHYGPDTGVSCYGRDSGSAANKVTIASQENCNEFVILIEHDKKIVVRGRACLSFNCTHTSINIPRLYGADGIIPNGFHTITAKIILMKFMSKLTKIKVDKLAKTHGSGGSNIHFKFPNAVEAKPFKFKT